MADLFICHGRYSCDQKITILESIGNNESQSSKGPKGKKEYSHSRYKVHRYAALLVGYLPDLSPASIDSVTSFSLTTLSKVMKNVC